MSFEKYEEKGAKRIKEEKNVEKGLSRTVNKIIFFLASGTFETQKKNSFLQK